MKMLWLIDDYHQDDSRVVKEGDKVYCITEYTYEEEPEHLEQPTIRLVGFMIYVRRL